jgi:subtilisin family serine protease
MGLWLVAPADEQALPAARERAPVPADARDLWETPAPAPQERRVERTLALGERLRADEIIAGQRILRFDDPAAYAAFLDALAAAGQSPLGRIDSLLVLRVSEEALGALPADRFGGREGFVFRVERPQTPERVAPAVVPQLSPFGRSAAEIVGPFPAEAGEGVRVAILDSGLSPHALLEDTRIEFLDLLGAGIAGPGAQHGTGVASIIGGRAGVAPGAELLIVRALDADGLGSSFEVARGLVAAVDAGADVVNLSLGLTSDDPVLRLAVEYARARDVLMVAAAGNDGLRGLPYPSAYAEVVAVTAVDGNGQQAVFPNQSEQIDFAAPGVGIAAAAEEGQAQLFSGTSAAAPFVSGTLAVLMSGPEGLGPDEAVALMRELANDQGAPGRDPLYGFGVVDWDRLRDRNEPDLLDLALADIYLPPDAVPGTSQEISVMVQNRGTAWASGANLQVEVAGAAPTTFVLGALGPGETVTRRISAAIPADGDSARLELSASVAAEAAGVDARPANDAKWVRFGPLP